MCVKEFLGYNCGHCSIPVLRPCPISQSNPTFPVCQYPAERPIFTNDFCHPCSRIIWNIKVLREEETHKERHMAGECLCEVIFEGEDREKRLRPRSGKGKDKPAEKETHGGAISREASGGKNERPGAERRYEDRGERSTGVGQYGSRGRRSVRDGSQYDQKNDGAVMNSQAGGGGSFGGGVEHRYADQGQVCAGSYARANFADGEWVQGYDGERHNVILGHGSSDADGSYGSHVYGPPGHQMHAGQDMGPGDWSRRDWDPAAQEKAYQYVGYVANELRQQKPVMPESGYGTAVAGSNYPSHLVWEGQTMLGQPGAGMKWYPQPDPSQPATTSNETAQPAVKGNEKSGKNTKAISKAHSEPSHTPYQIYAKSAAEDSEPEVEPQEEQAEAPVVSSDMVKPRY
ncbi:hypothetical protein LSUB1_G006916 [Lachnellula subtilissima]|uniref:Uncharacterized protein n=1 Tax=Lachnellula subtilissima TaxID=602034 RepID=A0A8H8REB4_9HELO|nr:hypothetical protein LSUB1_G006916 [Lachnellula subtilissima]